MKSAFLHFIFLTSAYIVQAQNDSVKIVRDTVVVIKERIVYQDTTKSEKDSLKIDVGALYVTVDDAVLKVKGHKKYGVSSLKSYVDASPDDFSKYLAEKLKASYSVKLKRKGGMLVVKEANFMEISSRPINMYADVQQEAGRMFINAAFELNKHYFLSPRDNEEEFEKARTFLHYLVKGYYIDHYTNLLNEIQGQYDELVKQKEDLLTERKILNSKNVQHNNKMAANLKKTAKAESMIQKSESEINVAENEVALNKQFIEELKAKIAEIEVNKGTSSEALAEALDKTSDLEKDIQKATKKVEKAEKNIAKENASILKAKSKIEEAKHENEHLSELIAQGKEDIVVKDREIAQKNIHIEQKQEYLNKIAIKLKNIY